MGIDGQLYVADSLSFPTRERGLKLALEKAVWGISEVVPHAGTWIEIQVTIFGGKFQLVVPHAGTWIEISIVFSFSMSSAGRSPRGNVD